MFMNDKYLWKGEINPRKAISMQKEMAENVKAYGEVLSPLYIAGIDIAVWRNINHAQAAVVVLKYPRLDIVEIKKATDEITFPYIPGLLSFREIPLIIKAWEKLTIVPDVIIVDGHGYAHPRRIGIASHLGILLDKPTIGCAKSKLCGVFDTPADETGSFSNLIHNEEIIGVALRTKIRVKPVFVSIGHRISLENAIYWVRQCCVGYRLPQPTRLAHIAAGSNL